MLKDLFFVIFVNFVFCLQISDYNFLPNTAELAEELKACLHESDDVPRDFTKLFDSALFQLDTSLVPKIIRYVFLLRMKCAVMRPIELRQQM